MTTVFIVLAEQGEYDDYSCWPIKVWLDRDKAEAHAASLNEEQARLHIRSRNRIDHKVEEIDLE